EEAAGANPSRFVGRRLPVENVNWFDAALYCNLRSRKEGLAPAYAITGAEVVWRRDAAGYRLPTEAEWEYACRAGTVTPFNTGSRITTEQANFNGTMPAARGIAGIFRGATTPVGTFRPNGWGLYDMHGNVYEWCWDWYGAYRIGLQRDPTGPATGSEKVIRGGCWSYSARSLRSASRSRDLPTHRGNGVGFRLLLPL
ncbi:MAG: formylglycine-generating enzyme family protein, partial [Spirochaetaceae bacterium]|nr:formylglycine-generating enzyme family protein [Spirochaetaceae bacterium]